MSGTSVPEAASEAVIAFNTTNAAIQGEKALMGQGMAVKVMPLPESIGAGCGICLRVAPGEARAALEALAQANIPTAGLYLAEASGGKTRYRPWNL